MRLGLLLALLAASTARAADFAVPALEGARLPEAPASAAGKAAPAGRVVLTIQPAAKKADAPVEKTLRESRIYDDIVADLNARYVLPSDLAVEAKTCGVAPSKATSWYDNRKITICYEDLREAANLMAPHAVAPMTPIRLAMGYARHVLYHETGHALIDMLKLPTTGREEDAADQFATLSLLRSGDGADIAARLAALTWLYSSRKTRPDFSDVHSADKQRYYDMLCLIYGKDPDLNGGVVGGRRLPEDRADACEAEYAHAGMAWDTLLAPYARKP